MVIRLFVLATMVAVQEGTLEMAQVGGRVGERVGATVSTIHKTKQSKCRTKKKKRKKERRLKLTGTINPLRIVRGLWVVGYFHHSSESWGVAQNTFIAFIDVLISLVSGTGKTLFCHRHGHGASVGRSSVTIVNCKGGSTESGREGKERNMLNLQYSMEYPWFTFKSAFSHKISTNCLPSSLFVFIALQEAGSSTVWVGNSKKERLCDGCGKHNFVRTRRDCENKSGPLRNCNSNRTDRRKWRRPTRPTCILLRCNWFRKGREALALVYPMECMIRPNSLLWNRRRKVVGARKYGRIRWKGSQNSVVLGRPKVSRSLRNLRPSHANRCLSVEVGEK